MKWLPRLLRRQQIQEADQALREARRRRPEIRELVRDTHVRGSKNNFAIRMNAAFELRAQQARQNRRGGR